MSGPTKNDVLAVVRRYRVLSHYRATSAATGTRYAVFGPEGQVTEPTSHREAQEMRDLLIAEDVLELFAEESVA